VGTEPKYVDWDTDVVGKGQVFTHLHSPETKRRRAAGEKVNVFSVLDSNKKLIGQVEGGALEDPLINIDRNNLQKHLNNPPNPKRGGQRGKERNTFISGVAVPLGSLAGSEDEEENIFVRPGHVSIGTEGGPRVLRADVEHMFSPANRPILRPTGEEKTIKRLGPQFDTVVVPKGQDLTSPVFGKAARFGDFGMRVISPNVETPGE
jgi:hypothetical protein